MAQKKQNKETKKTASFGKQKRTNNGKVKHAKGGEEIIDSRAKTDIVAVVLIVVGVALFAVSLVPTDAPVTSFLVNILRFIFGVGVFIFPFALIIWGGSFFFRMERQKISVRVAIGLSLIFVAVLTIISLCSTAIAMNRPEQLFDYETIINYGGIIGSAFS
ncbi:MAG: DNA translocase FtsK 4TM domain-containing protein [Coriobacteriia bacterium]|nr:DNA translocase FtsK 4TM domain-containing protein [Coriobacteriia bacterium]